MLLVLISLNEGHTLTNYLSTEERLKYEDLLRNPDLQLSIEKDLNAVGMNIEAYRKSPKVHVLTTYALDRERTAFFAEHADVVAQLIEENTLTCSKNKTSFTKLNIGQTTTIVDFITDVAERNAKQTKLAREYRQKQNTYDTVCGLLKYHSTNTINCVTPPKKPVVVIDLETLDTANSAAIIEIGAVFGDLETGLVHDTFHAFINAKAGANADRTVSRETLKWHVDTRLKQKESGKYALVPIESYFAPHLMDRLETVYAFLINTIGGWKKSSPIPIQFYAKGPEFDISALANLHGQLYGTLSGKVSDLDIDAAVEGNQLNISKLMEQLPESSCGQGIEFPFPYKNVQSVRTEELALARHVEKRYGVPMDSKVIYMFLDARSELPHSALSDALTEFELIYAIQKYINEPV